jgi:hypothetical protein
MKIAHALVDGTVKLMSRNGIVAVCTCGWQSVQHVSTVNAQIAFEAHVLHAEEGEHRLDDNA